MSRSNEPAHEILVLIAQATSEGSGEPAICAVSPEPSLFAHMNYGSRRRVRPKIRHQPHWITAHAYLKNEFTEDKKCQNLMSWLKCHCHKYSFGVHLHDLKNLYTKLEPPHDKTNKCHVRTAKTQIILGIRPVWSESSLSALWVAKDPMILHADSEDSDQTGRMPRRL